MINPQLLKTYKSLNDWHRFRIRLFGEGILVGLFSGLVISLFRFLLDLVEVRRADIYQYLEAGASPFLTGLWFLILALIALALFLMARYEPMASGSGIPQVKGVILGLMKMHWFRILWIKIVGGVAGIGAGLSLGREGPSIQVGAVTAQALSRSLGRTRMEERYLITSGASAGLAAAFNAPLAGTIFALEELHRNFSGAVLLPAMAAALTSTMVSRFFFGRNTIFGFYGLPTLPLKHMGFVVLIAIFAGIGGVIFNAGLLNINRFYDLRIFKNQYFKILFALICAGLLGFVLPQVLGGGAGLVNGLVQSDYTTTMLLIILAGKFLFTLISYGCGTPGGFFLPMLVLGALIGAIFANIMISSQLIAPAFGANVIILSMAAFFSSSVRAPITGTLLILEMTGSFQHMMVLAVASATAYIVAELLGGEPIYEALLMKSLKSKATHETRDERNIIEVPVCSGSSIENKRVSEIPWPEHTLLLEIKRDDKNIIVGAETRIRPGDFLYVLTESIHAPAVLKLGEEIVPKRLYGDF